VSDYKRVSGYSYQQMFWSRNWKWWMHFDYKLRDGICRNKSATFLMKKNGVI
jgi:hypothetical protein